MHARKTVYTHLHAGPSYTISFSTLYGNLHITLYQKCCKYLLTSLLPLTVTVAGKLVTAVEDANSGLLATQA